MFLRGIQVLTTASFIVVFNLENTNLYEIIPSEVCDLGTVSTASAFSSPTCGGDAV